MRQPWFPTFALLALALVAAAGRAPSCSAAEPWRWPLDLEPRAVTGTFMEPRSAHWHAGLDIRTEGRIGAEVRAPVAGWISRLRTSPHGYGKAIYLRTADGHTLVFAHLSALAQRLHQPVLRAQARTGRYRQDLSLEPGALRVKRGELIALSGATGTGAPHLHLEVRGPDGRPRDPQHWLPAADDAPPQIRGLRLVPLTPDSRLEGRARPCRAAAGDTIHAVGSIGVQADAVDRTGAAPFPVMPKGMELRFDSKTIYRLEQESYAFSEGRQMRLEIAFAPDDDERVRYTRLYRREGNTLAGRVGDGHLQLAADLAVHTLELVAWDIHGHRDSITVYLRADARSGGAGRPGGRAWAPTRIDVESSLEIWASEAVLEVRAGDDPIRVFDPAALGSGVHALPLADDAFDEIAFLTGGGGIASVQAPSSPVRLTDAAGRGLFSGGLVWVEEVEQRPAAPAGLQPVGPAVRIRAAGAALRAGLDLEIDLPAATPDTDRILLFRVDRRGRWGALPTQSELRGERRVFVGELEAFGLVAAARDTSPPDFGPFRVDGRALREGAVLREVRSAVTAIARPHWPVISISLADSGSGLPDEGPVVTLDGRRFPARWDPEQRELLLELFVDPGPGVHEFVVAAEDRAGNRAARSIRLELRGDG